MARTNTPKLTEKPKTAEGADASRINARQQLRRSVLACMLWEDNFYQSGSVAAETIAKFVPLVSPEECYAIAIEARERQKLRHAPLWIAVQMAKHETHRPYVRALLARIVQRVDEVPETLALYAKGRSGTKKLGKLAHSIQRGLADAFRKFNAYQLGKYDRDGEVKLKDALRIVHPTPENAEQSSNWKAVLDGTLATPDTWEVAISAAKSKDEKKAAWQRLLTENKLGALALLRNLRNMQQAGIEDAVIGAALATMKTERVLPFRFVSAAQAAKKLEPQLEQAMLGSLSQVPKLAGKTILIVDVSGSMYGGRVSSKSDMDRARAACTLATFVREVCEQPVIYATAGSDAKRIHKTELVPARRGFALVDAIYAMCSPLGGGGIFLRQVMDFVFEAERAADRIIVITDEQDCDIYGSPANANAFGTHNYLINVSNEKNGVGYGKWTHIDGWSEACLDFIRESEALAD